jgi:hypothetical protein
VSNYLNSPSYKSVENIVALVRLWQLLAGRNASEDDTESPHAFFNRSYIKNDQLLSHSESMVASPLGFFKIIQINALYLNDAFNVDTNTILNH